MIVQVFYPPGETIEFDCTMIKILSVIDLTLTVTIIFFEFCLWSNIPVFYGLLSLFQVMHVFSWAGGLTLSAPVYHIGYMITILVVYMLSWVPDFASVVWRIKLLDPEAEDAGHIYFAAVMNVLLLFIDSCMVIAIGNLLPNCINYMDNIKLGLSNSVDNQKMIESYHKEPEDLHTSRMRIFNVATAEIILVTIVLIVNFLGLNFSRTFGYLALFQMPHVFLWIGTFGVSKGINDKARLVIFILAYFISIFLDVASILWRIKIIIDFYSFTTSSWWWSIFYWIVCLAVLGLVICSMIAAFYCYTIQNEIANELERLGPIIKPKLYVYAK